MAKPIIQTQLLSLDDGYRLQCTIVDSDVDKAKPLLLFIVGSTGLGAFYHRLAVQLSSNFHCVYYNRRGFVHTVESVPSDHESPNATISTGEGNLITRQARDAAFLIQTLDTTKWGAYVFATSFGATIALELVVRHTDLVRRAVLHEVILPKILPPGTECDSIVSAFHNMAKSEAPFAVFAVSLLSPPHLRSVRASFSNQGNDFWSRGPRANLVQALKEAAAAADYRPGVEKIRAIFGELVLMTGKESRGLPVRSMVDALGRELDKGVVEIEGGHFSFMDKRCLGTVGDAVLQELLGDVRRSGAGARM